MPQYASLLQRREPFNRPWRQNKVEHAGRFQPREVFAPLVWLGDVTDLITQDAVWVDEWHPGLQ